MPTRPLNKALQSSGAQWFLLILLSTLFSAVFNLAHLPASLLMGAMAAAILLATRGVSLRVSPLLHVASQAIIGTMIARTMSLSILETFRKDWLISLGVVVATVTMASVLGWLLGRIRVLPGTTAIWGLSPGAASVMMLMAEAYGADARLVAFMQYLRVVIVVSVASLVVRFWVHPLADATKGTSWFSPVHWPALGATLLVVVTGAVAGRFLKIPAGAMLVPMVVGAVLHGAGLMTLELPQGILAASYTLLGWGIGLGFNRGIIRHALEALPKTILAILVLVLFSGGIALFLVRILDVDPLTAYLATSPGGMDSVAIIAASTRHIDLPFVMLLQTVRFLVVLLAGPFLSRFLADRIAPVTIPAGAEKSENRVLLNRISEDEDELD